MQFGGIGFVERLARSPLQMELLFRTAVAVAALDYYLARATPPRAKPGGNTNPSNTRRWDELGPYLFERVREVSTEQFPGSLLSRAVFAATTDDAHPAAEIERRVKQQFDESGMFKSVDVDVDRSAPVVGGAAWLRSETLSALETVRKGLAEKTPVLIELIRDPATAPSSAQVVVAFRMDRSEDEPERLYCFDPAQASVPLTLDVWCGQSEMRIYDTGSGEEHVAPRGIRVIALPRAVPPLFGFRRYTRYVLPWRFFWWLKRRWNTFAFRKREQQLATAPAHDSDQSAE